MLRFQNATGILLLLLIICNSVIAQEKKSMMFDFTDTIHLDPEIRYGKLENGFTYYIKNNIDKKRKGSVLLAVKAGSILEDEDQLGLAHFLEHMAFNGSKHFPDVFTYLEEHGFQRGREVNAAVDFDKTSYWVDFNGSNNYFVDTILLIMRDIAQEMSLNPHAIESERGVVLGEMRTRGGYLTRMKKRYYPMLLNNSRYAHRDAMGTKKSVLGFDHGSLTRYYKDWYRPDLQGIIIVGDIDQEKIERQIKGLFNDLKNPVPAREREDYRVPLTGKNQFIIITDKECPDTQIKIYMKRDGGSVVTKQDFHNSLLVELYDQMMKLRFEYCSNQYNPPFSSIGHSTERILNLRSLHTYIDVKPGKIKEGFQFAMTEVERVKRYGFTDSELRKAKDFILASLSLGQKNDSKALVNRYLDHFVHGEGTPAIDYRYDLTKELLARITIEEINQIAKSWISDNNRDIVILAPEKGKALLPSEVEIQGWISEIRYASIKPINTSEPGIVWFPARNFPNQDLINVKKSEIKEIGVTTLRLENGATVVLKQVNSPGRDSDRILFHAFSKGGASSYNTADYFSAISAAEIIENSGAGSLNKFEINKYLSGTSVKVHPYMSDEQRGIRGSSNRSEIETMMQLVHQYFISPNKNVAAFADWKANKRASVQHEETDIQLKFENTIKSILENRELGKWKLSYSELKKIDSERVYQIYKENFSDASSFTFILTGNFDELTITPHLLKYLGTLPATDKIKNIKNDNRITHGDRVNQTFYWGLTEDKASVHLVFSSKFYVSSENKIISNLLGNVLQTAMTNRLREKENGTYFVMAQTAPFKSGTEYMFRSQISFDCAPDNVQRMIAAALDEVSQLQREGLNADAFDNLIIQEKEKIKSQLGSDVFWMSYLSAQYKDGIDPVEFLQRSVLLDSITNNDIRLAAGRYLSENNLMQFILLPKSKKPTKIAR